MKQLTFIFLALLSSTILIACSSGTGDVASDGTSDASGGRGGSQNGFLTIDITDAPVDGAKEVWVRFYGIELKPTSAENTITLSFKSPMDINLLDLQGQKSYRMLTDATLPAGKYDWLRLNVMAVNDGITDSYIKLKDSSVHELDIPAGSESGLKIIGGLEIIANTPTRMTIDFDLRKSIIATGSGYYSLKPVLRLVDNTAVSSINGTVQVSALTGSDCPDADPSTGNAVYLYDGLNVTPDDVDNIAPDPVASAIPTLNNITGIYEYDLGFVPLGKYTAAYTCEAGFDEPEIDNTIIFSKPVNVNLTSMTTLTLRTFK